MKTSDNGIDLIKRFEGFRENAYRDTGGVWTIGWGHTGGVKKGDRVTKEKATEYLKHDLSWAEREVNSLGPMPQVRFDALVSLVFNIGASAFRGSTLRKHLVAKRPAQDIGRQWNRWVYDNGRRINGLVIRRKEEFELWESATADADVLKVGHDLPMVYTDDQTTSHQVVLVMLNILGWDTVDKFQRDNLLVPDGIVGEITWRKMIEVAKDRLDAAAKLGGVK